MLSIKTVYENGMFRPLQSLDLQEGTEYMITLTENVSNEAHESEDEMTGARYEAYLAALAELAQIAALPLQSPSDPYASQITALAEPVIEPEFDRVDEDTYLAFLKAMDEIAALPLQGPPQPHTVRDHDAILYPKHGEAR